MMTVDQAYDIALAKVKELEKGGIGVTITDSSSADDPETVGEYSTPQNVSPDKWVHVSFHPKTDEEWDKVFAAQDELAQQGISFDTGAGMGDRDWELDWSFSYNPQPEKKFENSVYVEDFARWKHALNENEQEEKIRADRTYEIPGDVEAEDDFSKKITLTPGSKLKVNAVSDRSNVVSFKIVGSDETYNVTKGEFKSFLDSKPKEQA